VLKTNEYANYLFSLLIMYGACVRLCESLCGSLVVVLLDAEVVYILIVLLGLNKTASQRSIKEVSE
jgi:hypothetical protein